MSLRAREPYIACLCIVMEQTPANHYLDPFLLALLMVLRLKAANFFKSICSSVDGPEETMQYLSELPGGAQLVAGCSGQIIEAYLIASDPNKERKELRHIALQRQVNETDMSDPPAVKFRVRQLTDMKRHIYSGFRDSVSLVNITRKIDLATSVRD